MPATRPTRYQLSAAAAALLLLWVQGCDTKPKPPAAQSNSPFATPEHSPVKARLIAQHASVPPGGQTLLGLFFTIDPEWHIYAKEPGDAGLPTKIQWRAPSDGVTIEDLDWPVPETFLDAGNLTTHGYQRQVLLPARLSLNASAAAGTLPLKARVTWLACKELCVPGGADVELDLPVDPATPLPGPDAVLFQLGTATDFPADAS